MYEVRSWGESEDDDTLEIEEGEDVKWSLWEKAVHELVPAADVLPYEAL